MARRPSPPPAPPVLTAEQIRRRIDGLRRCIAELEAFRPETVQKRYNGTEVIAIETSIKDALEAAFGHGTPRYKRFEDAANLDQGPHTMRIAPVLAAAWATQLIMMNKKLVKLGSTWRKARRDRSIF